MQARHSAILAAWKQVFCEAGARIPPQNVERLLRTTWVRVPSWDERRLDLVVPGLSVDRGLPLFCDATIISSITRFGEARAGTSNRGGALLERAERENNITYTEVAGSNLASLQCLSCEVYGRWGRQCVELVPKLARERSRGLARRVRRGAMLRRLRADELQRPARDLGRRPRRRLDRRRLRVGAGGRLRDRHLAQQPRLRTRGVREGRR